MAFDKLITNLTVNLVKTTERFNSRIIDLQNQFSNQCPTNSELERIIAEKNQLTTALTQTQSSLSAITQTGQSLSSVVNSLNTAITVIRLIPIPTAVPPGAGIPISVLTNLSDILIKLSDFVKNSGNTLSTIPQVTSNIIDSINSMVNQLTLLDQSILNCLEENFQSTIPEGTPESEIPALQNEFYESLNYSQFDQSTVSLSGQEFSEEELIERLNPNSTNPIFYPIWGVDFYIDENPEPNPFRLTLQFDPQNEVSLPRRRIKAFRVNEEEVVLTGDYSYTNSITILVEEMKFQIQQFFGLNFDDTTENIEINDEIISNLLPPTILGFFQQTPGDVSFGEDLTLVANFINGVGVVNPGNIPVESTVPFIIPNFNENTVFTLTVTNDSGDFVEEELGINITNPPEEGPAILNFSPVPGSVESTSFLGLTPIIGFTINVEVINADTITYTDSDGNTSILSSPSTQISTTYLGNNQPRTWTLRASKANYSDVVETISF